MNEFDKYHDLAARLLGKEDFPLPLPNMERDYPHNVGLLSDAEESELTAKVLNHTRGMTLEVWKNLGLGQRVPWLQIAVDNLRLVGDDGRQREAEIRSSLRDRAGANQLLIDADEVATWPGGLLEHLVREGVLSPSNTAKSVVCDACGEDHVEAVEYIKSPPSSELRAYISCPANGRVAVPLNRLRRWSIAAAAVSVSPEHPSSPLTADDPLSERAQHVLVAMLELGATDSDSRQSTDEIATKALGGNADGNALKAVMADLNTREYVRSRTGRRGGCWLTEKGRIRADKLRKG